MIRMENISKSYQLGKVKVPVLECINLSIEEGEYVAIMGPSGSGKSTLMNIIGVLDQPTSGIYELCGEKIVDKSDNELATIRNRLIGFVFQQFNLLPRLTARKNVELPMLYAGVPPKERRKRAEEALHSVGLGDRMDHKPSELSGGQQQRAAIARALAVRPAIILADEPTGALDSNSGKEIMRIFKRLNEEGMTIIMVTHDHEIARQAHRIIQIRDGRIVKEAEVPA